MRKSPPCGSVSAYEFLLFFVALFVALFATSAGTAPPDSPSVPSHRGVTAVRVNGPGRLFLGGTLFRGPWTLTYERGRFTVNGYALRPEPPLESRRDSLRRAQLELIERAEVLAESLRHSSLSVPQRQLRLKSFCEASGLGGIVDTLPGVVRLRFASGANMWYSVAGVQTAGMTLPGPQPTASTARGDHRTARLFRLKEQLERGCVIFVTSSAGEVVVPERRALECMAAIERLKSGSEPDSADRRVIPSQVRDQLKRPLPLDKIW